MKSRPPLGVGFVLGAMLILSGLFLPMALVGRAGWALCLLGLAGTGVSGFLKLYFQRAAARRVASAAKQLELVRMQLRQAKEERDDLDRRLPRGGGPLVARLQNAEKDLAALEELLPIDARRQTAGTDERKGQYLGDVDRALCYQRMSRANDQIALIRPQRQHRQIGIVH